MHFLQSLQAAAPLQLRPDRPASTHQLSLDQLRLDQASSQLQQRKQREQLAQVDRLSEIIREKDRQLEEQEGRQLQRQLLFEIEVDRLRRILSEWDGERRKHSQDSKAKQNLYRTRLEELKTALSAQFTQRVDQIRAETRNDLQRIKELYDIRVSKLQEESMKEEHRLRLAEMEAGSQMGRLQISEADRQKLQATLLLRQSRITELEEQLQQLQQERRKLKDENDRLAEDKARQLEYLRMQQDSKEEQYAATKALVSELQATVEQLRIDKQQWNDSKRRAGDRVAALEIRCESLQQEVQQFRSRKTQHAFLREASQNTLSHQQSERQQLSLSPVLKDSRSLPLSRPRRQEAGIADISEQHEHERRRVVQLEEQLRLLQAECDSQKEELAIRIAGDERNEEALRQANRDIDSLKKVLEERDRDLSKLKVQMLQLEGKASQREEIIARLQGELERNDGGKAERVWLERLARAEQALQALGTEWTKRERQLTGLFKKIDSTYRAQVEKGREAQERLRKENEEIHLLLMEKIKQLSAK